MCHFRGGVVEAGRKRPNKNPVVGQWRCATKTTRTSLFPSHFLSSSYRNCFLRVCRGGRRTSGIFALLAFVDPRCAAALDFVCCAGCNTTGELGWRWQRERRWLRSRGQQRGWRALQTPSFPFGKTAIINN